MIKSVGSTIESLRDALNKACLEGGETSKRQVWLTASDGREHQLQGAVTFGTDHVRWTPDGKGAPTTIVPIAAIVTIRAGLGADLGRPAASPAEASGPAGGRGPAEERRKRQRRATVPSPLAGEGVGTK